MRVVRVYLPTVLGRAKAVSLTILTSRLFDGIGRGKWVNPMSR